MGKKAAIERRNGEKQPQDARELLRANLDRLMEHARANGKPELGYAVNLELESGVSDSVINRGLKKDRAFDADQIALLAMAYDLQPWELLYPGLDPDAPPSAQIDELYRIARDRVRSDEQALDKLAGGGNARPRTRSNESDGGASHEVPADGETKRRNQKP